jgi:restriction system protein
MTTQRTKPPQPEPQKNSDHDHPNGKDEAVPLVPGWVQEGGFFVLLFPMLILLAVIAHVGQLYGPACGCTLFILTWAVIAALWLADYRRRLGAARGRLERLQWELHWIAVADALGWQQFENYAAELLRASGYRDVRIIGSTRYDKGVDIIATDPDGTAVAIQCKHRKRGSIGPSVVRELVGAIHSFHQGRCGMIITNVRMTPGAHEEAAAAGIVVIDRPLLQQWMGQIRDEIEQRDNAPTIPPGVESPASA